LTPRALLRRLRAGEEDLVELLHQELVRQFCFHCFGWRGCDGSRALVIVHEFRHLPATLRRPCPVAHDVLRDLVEIRHEGSDLRSAGQCGPRAQKDLLGEVLGLVEVLDVVGHKAVDPVAVAVPQDVESTAITRSAAVEQRLLGGFTSEHCSRHWALPLSNRREFE